MRKSPPDTPENGVFQVSQQAASIPLNKSKTAAEDLRKPPDTPENGVFQVS